jgi:hypothetical protein
MRGVMRIINSVRLFTLDVVLKTFPKSGMSFNIGIPDLLLVDVSLIRPPSAIVSPF